MEGESPTLKEIELVISLFKADYPDNIYLFKFNNKNMRKSFEICSKLSMTSFWCFFVGFFLLTMNMFPTFINVSAVDFEQVNVSWVTTSLQLIPD